MKVFSNIRVVFFLFIILILSSVCLPQTAQTSGVLIPDSFLLTDTPLWLGSKIGFNKIMTVRSSGKTHFYVIKDSPAYMYLKKHNDQVNIEEVYPGEDNPFEMPSMILFTPLDLESTDVKKLMGNELFNELIKSGKVKGSMLLEQLEFYPVIFSKIDDEFEVSKWLPKFLLPKLMSEAKAQVQYEEESVERKQKIEDSIIDEIKNRGVGKRFLISEILPEKGGKIGSYTIKEGPSSAQATLIVEYPKDVIPLRFVSNNPFLPSMEGSTHKDYTIGVTAEGLYVGDGTQGPSVGANGHGSVWRFKGKHLFKGYTFEGNNSDPLAFIFLEGTGFVYITGNGKVTMRDGSIKILPEGKKE